jgi:alpha-N-arabinofuranosidase
MLTVNLGTGSPEEARNWVEYCNAPTGTKYADMRAANGNEQPYGVKLWCLGNEMDGPWQLGHVPADQYAIRAQQAAKMMKDTDPTIELVACGSCTTDLPTYMEWDRQVLEYIGEFADYLSLHRYVGNFMADTPDYLAVTNSIDQQIEEMAAVCRYVQAKNRSRKPIFLCFDEWNVWYRTRQPADLDGRGKFAPHLLEEVYNLEDALVVAGFLNSFIRHANVLKVANLAQIVNVIAPILTRNDDLLIQSIYYPLAMYTKRRDGVALQTVVRGPTYEGKTNGQATYVDASAILNDDQLHIFVTNRNPAETATVHITLADRAIVALDSAECLTGPNAEAANSFEQPDLIQAHPFQDVEINSGQARLTLRPLSVAALSFQLAADRK